MPERSSPPLASRLPASLRRALGSPCIPVAAVAAATGWQVVTLARVLAARLTFPLELEWLEGHTLEECWRAAHAGAPLYGDPGLGWQTQIYTPLYFAVVGALGRVVGLDYWTGRLVSDLALGALCALVFHVVARRAPDRAAGAGAGLLAVGAVLAAYPRVGGWYDFARVDTLALALLVGCAAVLGRSDGVARAAAAGLLLAASIYTKQTAAVFAPWLVAFALGRDRRSGAIFAAVATATGAATLLVLQAATGGWFSFWILLASHQSLEPERLRAVAGDLLVFAPYVPLTLVATAWLLLRRRATAETTLWWGLLVSALPAGLMQVLKVGGTTNGLMPTLVLAPVATLLSARDGLEAVTSNGGARRGLAAGALLLAGALYVALWTFPAAPYLPTATQHEGALALDGLAAALPGGALAPSHPFLLRRADPTRAQLMGLGYAELFWAGQQARADILADVARIEPQWVLLSDGEDAFARRLGLRYRPWCRIEPTYAAFGSNAPHLVYRLARGGLVRAETLEASASPPCGRSGFTCAIAAGADGRPVLHVGMTAAGRVHVELGLAPTAPGAPSRLVRVHGDERPASPATPGGPLGLDFDGLDGDNVVSLDPGAGDLGATLARITCSAGGETLEAAR